MNIYIDESGSITFAHANQTPYFVIALIKVTNKKKLQRIYKRFISSRRKALLAIDTKQVMFTGDKFKEIKGSALNEPLLADFINFFAQNNYFEIYYIKIKNKSLQPGFCENTARAFNYTLRLAIQRFLNSGSWDKDLRYHLQLDERNEKTDTKHFLQNYLNTELYTSGIISKPMSVSYFDSSNNQLIQLADVFSNLFYKYLHNRNKYEHYIDHLKQKGYIKFVYEFPYYSQY